MPPNDPIDRARLEREAEERRRSAGRHPAYEPSDPPPSTPPRKRHFDVKGVVGLVKDLGTIAAVIGAIVLWFQTRASREEVDAAKKECIATAASAIAAGLAPIPPRLKAIEKRLARDDQRWDGLDAWHSQVFASPKKTSPPKFGPTAERRGEVRYYESDDVSGE